MFVPLEQMLKSLPLSAGVKSMILTWAFNTITKHSMLSMHVWFVLGWVKKIRLRLHAMSFGHPLRSLHYPHVLKFLVSRTTLDPPPPPMAETDLIFDRRSWSSSRRLPSRTITSNHITNSFPRNLDTLDQRLRRSSWPHGLHTTPWRSYRPYRIQFRHPRWP